MYSSYDREGEDKTLGEVRGKSDTDSPKQECESNENKKRFEPETKKKHQRRHQRWVSNNQTPCAGESWNNKT